MVTASHIIRKMVRENPFLLEGLSKDIISHGNLADYLKEAVEKELGKKVQHAALVMALRRFSEELYSHETALEQSRFHGEIILRTNMVDINVVKSASLLAKVKHLYSLVDFEKGDVLNIILGSNEVAIITNDRYKKKVLHFLKNEKIIVKQDDVASVSVLFSSKKFLKTPGVIFSATRRLAWEGINIFEVVSTYSELTFILEEEQATKAISVLKDLFKK